MLRRVPSKAVEQFTDREAAVRTALMFSSYLAPLHFEILAVLSYFPHAHVLPYSQVSTYSRTRHSQLPLYSLSTIHYSPSLRYPLPLPPYP